ncbi:hypothetical protein CGLAUT_08330 [Corynebacterium glaucum]|uniref:DUF3040 domain-containing protein n=1 Tax=Corynebacterium glaucum TaxID=187491 RepID=UPI0025B3EACD|nr:DUF3040 domain-containing protein [Corynebacterium glaucum]WJZ08147.1 hypothetical protein CGLAUT_08330 [Corynebacterium glaucum]
MSLSEQEQQALREIEQSLLAEDPKFGSDVAHEVGFSDAPRTGQLTMRSVALMVLGLVLLIGGVALASMSMWAIVISVLGFGVMMAGGVMALRAPVSNPGSSRVASTGERQRSQRSVAMEENFRRRFEDRQ